MISGHSGCRTPWQEERLELLVDALQLEQVLAQMELAENSLFRLLEAEPAMIHQPELQDVLSHLKGAVASLEAAKKRLEGRGSRRPQRPPAR